MSHLLAKIKFQSQVTFVDRVDILDLMNSFETAKNLKELNLPHPLLINLHFAAQKVHLFLLEGIASKLSQTHEILEQTSIFSSLVISENLLIGFQVVE